MKISTFRSIGIFVIATGIIISTFNIAANAASLSWTDPKPSVSSTKDTQGGWDNWCKKKFQSDQYEIPLRGESDTKTYCIIGTFNNVKLLSYSNLHNLAVQFPGDKVAYPVTTSCISSCVYLPSKDVFMTVETSNDVRSGRIAIHKNFIQNLRLQAASTPATSYYAPNQPNADAYINDFYGNPGYMGAYVKHMQRSSNDKWLVVEFVGAGIFRIDISNLEDMKMLKFSDWPTQYAHSMPTIEFDITNDGEHVAILGINTINSLFDIIPGCGIPMSITPNPSAIFEQQQNPCPEKSLDSLKDSQGNNLVVPSLRTTYIPNFTEEGGEISLYAMSYDNIPVRQVSLRAANYTPTSLSYLALGDSFSSGEGDTEQESGGKFYRSYTNTAKDLSAGQPEEKCHVSTRSYPYKLALGMNLSISDPRQWNSVACSGAQTIDVAPEDRESDRGQGNRLAEFDNYSSLKSTALNEIIPGRVKQLDFVKKYKPDAITLTMGGNDVGFAEKLQACVTSATTCDYARESYRAKMRSEIQNMFKDLAGLYRSLSTEGNPNAKVYVLGYPQFITDNAEAICANTFWLDVNERKMIVESVNYMNSIIKAAAKNAGVYYVDISNSLGEHKLCGSHSEKHVTAITGLGGFNGNDIQESFHPNAKGHADVAKSVNESTLNNSNLLEFDICPTSDQNRCEDSSSTLESVPVPAYFQEEGGYINVKYLQVTVGDPVAGAALAMSLRQFFFAPGQPVTVTLFSDPTPLGTFNASADGSLDIAPTIPANIAPGYHRLTLQGKSYSGEPVEYEQVVLVKSNNPADIDGDGVADTQDKCRFVQPVNIDADSDGNDDACDPEITGPTEPYRVRAGNPDKSYAGQPEKANYLYVERNTRVPALTGIANDYDTDHDGWVVVAASQNDGEAGPHSRFWIDGNDGSKVPHLAFRTNERGCIQYKPEDLSQITETNNNTPRKFTQEAVDTNTCRSEPADADLDNDGQPDNTQPLYLARRGDASKGEDTNKFYLFRSTRAAEAQLGKSDYAANDPLLLGGAPTVSPTDTKDYRQPWSLLASASYTSPIFPGHFTKLKLINNYPYVLTGQTSLFFTNCTAYKPASLNTIKQSDQTTRPLQLDTWQSLLLQLQWSCNN